MCIALIDWRRGMVAIIVVAFLQDPLRKLELDKPVYFTLEYIVVDWPVLGDVGTGFWMFQEDAVLTAHSGFFRASEIAAWHTATAVCILMLLASVRRISMKRVVVVNVITVALLAIGIL